MRVIVARKLTKVFRKRKTLPGLGGKIKSIFLPEYAEISAVNRVSFSVEEGEVLGFLGPNGAGKTTCIRMLCGILRPTSGKLRVLGKVPYLERKTLVKRIGAIFGHKSQLPLNLKAKDAVEIISMYYNVEKTDFEDRFWRYAAFLDVEDLVERRVRELSLGERMRFEIMASLIHDPEIIFMDEPTIGLDFVAKERIRSLVKGLGKTVVFTSHDALDIESVCSRVLVIHGGKIIADSTIDELRKMIPFKTAEIICERPIDSVPPGWERIGETAIKRKIKTFREVERALRTVEKFGVIDVTVSYPSLEEIFIKLYGGRGK